MTGKHYTQDSCLITVEKAVLFPLVGKLRDVRPGALAAIFTPGEESLSKREITGGGEES